MKGWRERAADIFAKHGEIAAKMKSAPGPLEFSVTPPLLLHQRGLFAAAHAFAADPGLFGKVEFAEPPPSWAESVERSLDVPMSICVNGALLAYDWTDLSPRAEILYNSH